MGWSYERATHYDGKGNVDRKAQALSEISSDYKVLKAVCKGSVVYVAVEDPDKNVSGLVILTQINNHYDFNFGCKFVSEDMGPCERECPESILNLLTPTDSEWANEWRADCRAKVEKRKELKNLPVGTRIHVRNGLGEVTLIKSAPCCQFKRPFWAVEGTNSYMNEHCIAKYKYEIVA